MFFHFKGSTPWTANAFGHKLIPMFVREFKRGGAEQMLLGTVQFESYFGEPMDPNKKYLVDGINTIKDPYLPDDQAKFVDSNGVLLGQIINLWFPPKKKE